MTTTAATRGLQRRSWRLGSRTRKAFLLVHILSAGAWVGIDIVMGVLVFTALLTDDVRTAALSYQALGLFAVWPTFVTGTVCLATGIVLGLGTKYGLVRYWWVLVKLVLNVVLVALVYVALRGGVAEAVAYGEGLAQAGAPLTAEPSDIVFPPIVSPTALLIAFLLAVYKPWGRIRRTSR